MLRFQVKDTADESSHGADEKKERPNSVLLTGAHHSRELTSI